MRRFAAVALLGFFVAGCQDDIDRTVAPDDADARAQQGGPGGGPPAGAAIEARINDLIKDLFPQPEQGEANQLFAEMKAALAEGDTAAAQQSASELLQLAGSTELEDPPGPTTAAEALGELIALLADFTGLDVPEVPPEALSTDGDDGTVAFAIADDGQADTIVTDEEFAGTVIEDQDIDEDLVIVIERLTVQEQQQLPGRDDCLPTDLEQAEGCYQFDRFPEGSFAPQTTEVGVCHETPIADGFRLAKFESAADGGEGEVVFLPPISVGFLDCTGFQVVSSDDSPAAWRLARRAWSATGGKLLDWLGPAPLRAIDTGVGGTATNWSKMGWAKPLEVEKTAGDGQQAAAGSTLPTDPTVQVTEAHGPNPSPVQGVDVQFAVVEGGGSVSSSTATTDANGNASVSWTLGNTGCTQELRATVPRDTVVFTATTSDNCQIFGVDSSSDAYYSLDPASGDTTFIRKLDPDPNDTIPRFTTPVGMAMNSSQEVFVWNNSDPNDALLELDRCSGQMTVVDSLINAGDALAFESGTLYSLDGSTLSELDPATGSVTATTTLSRSLVNAGGHDATSGGDLMAARLTVPTAKDTLFRIDPTSGTVTQIGALSTNIGTIGTLAFDGSGQLWGSGFNGPDGDIIFQIDTASAAVSGIQQVEQAPQGMAFSGACP